MKRLILATTSLVVAGGMAAAEVSVSGSAELGIAGEKGKDAKLHKDIDVNFSMSGETDSGLSFGASIDLDETGEGYDDDGHVNVSGAFGTLTLGDTDGGFDAALSEVGSGASLADNHTTHPGYNGNSGLDGAEDLANNGGNILRYDYTFGGVTTSASAEMNADDNSASVYGLGVAWTGDVGGIGMGIGLGYQSGKSPTTSIVALNADGKELEATADGDLAMHDHDSDTATPDIIKVIGDDATEETPRFMVDKDVKASIVGLSASADMGNGFSVVANISKKTHEVTVEGDYDSGNSDIKQTVSHAGLGITYTTGDLTIGVNGGQSTTKEEDGNDDNAAKADVKHTGAGVAVTYELGTGASLQLGVGNGKEGDTKKSSWSAGLAFSF